MIGCAVFPAAMPATRPNPDISRVRDVHGQASDNAANGHRRRARRV